MKAFTTEDLRKASTSIYAAVEEPVATEISSLLNWAAKTIDALRIDASASRADHQSRLPKCPKCGAVELGDECDMCGTQMGTH